MKGSAIRPGERYRVVDIYNGVIVDVLVLDKSDSVEDHWVCRRETGARILLPSSAFLKQHPRGE
jgi:hypothetical protein